MLRLLSCIAAGTLGISALATGETPPAAPVFAPLAHSALVTVEAAPAGRTLLLRVHRAGDGQALAGAELSVTIDGTAAAAALLPDGTWALPLPQPAANAQGKLGLVVAHDGLREVLDAQLPAAAGAGAAGAGATAAPAPPAGWLSALAHKQMSWWVLNIAIVLIGVVAISRRMS